MIKKIFYCLILSSSLFAQQLITVNDAVELALKNNYQITIAKESINILENNISLGNAGFIPEINADGSYSKSIMNSDQEFSDGETISRNNASSTNANASIDLNWTIFDGFRSFANLSRYKQLKQNGELGLKKQTENLIYSVVVTYFNIVKEEKILKTLKENLNLSADRLDIMKDKKELGSASRFDVLQAEVDFNEDKSSVTHAESRIVILKQQLSNLIFVKDEFNYSTTDSIVYKEDLQIDVLKENALKYNNDIKLAEQTLSLNNIDKRIAYSQYYPMISLFSGYSFSKSDAEASQIRSNRSYGFNYGVRGTWNIFDGFNTNRLIENLTIENNIANLELNDVIKNTTSRLNEFYENYKTNLLTVKVERDNVETARENYLLALEQFKLGTISQIEFRTIQQSYLNAGTRLYSAEYDVKTSEAELLRISGGFIK